MKLDTLRELVLKIKRTKFFNVKTLKRYKTKLLKIKLLKAKTWKPKKNIDYLLIKNMEVRLKKILHIIYKFHVANKKILFIGTPLKLNYKTKQLLKSKKHNFVPESIWMNGIITNSKSSFKYLTRQYVINKDKSLKFLFHLKKQANLIVVLNENSNLTAFKESTLKRIPIISLNASCNFSDFTSLSTYKAIGDYSFTKKTIRNRFFFLLLNSVLKKAERAKLHYPHPVKTQKKLKNFFKPRKNAFKKKKQI